MEIPPGGHQLLDADSGRQDQNQQKFLRTVTIRKVDHERQRNECQLLKKCKYDNNHKMKNKPDPAILRTSDLSN
jgi:hypothetical protein